MSPYGYPLHHWHPGASQLYALHVAHDEHQPTQPLTWTVAAEPDGALVDKTISTELSYLYWEAM
jgi:hypothetical protein